MQRRRGSPFSFLIAARSAAKLVLLQGSRTIWDFRRVSPAKRLRRAHSFKRRNLVLSLRFRSRSSSLIVHSRRCIALRSTTASRSTDERSSSHQVRATGDLRSKISTVSRELASLCEGREIVLVGGGNSAGQAAVFLSSYARRVHMAVRSSGVDASMSRYLIDRIAATPNIDLRVRTAVTGLSGTTDGILESVDLICRESGDIRKVDAQYMFLFIGADPNTQWLDRRIALDNK